MAIELKIDRYCGNCGAFTPTTEVHTLFADNKEYMKQTYVICKNKQLCRYLCKKLEKYIRQEIEEENRLNDESRTEENGEGKEES